MAVLYLIINKKRKQSTFLSIQFAIFGPQPEPETLQPAANCFASNRSSERNVKQKKKYSYTLLNLKSAKGNFFCLFQYH